jgi:hypothetical protein
MSRRKMGHHEAMTRHPSVEFLRNPMKALHALENPPAPTTAAQRLAPERRAEMRAALAAARWTLTSSVNSWKLCSREGCPSLSSRAYGARTHMDR